MAGGGQGSRSQSFVDEPAGRLVLLPVAPLEIEAKADPAEHNDEVDGSKPLGVAIARAKEADVVEEQEDDEGLSDEGYRRGHDGLPPVHVLAMVLAEVQQ